MNGLLQWLLIERLDYFMLLLLRVSSLILSSPLFGRRNIPNTVKTAFCLVLTYFFYVSQPVETAPAYDTMWGYIGLCVTEMVFGLILGFITNIFFQLVFTSGHIIDIEMGFGMVNVLDPQSNLQVPVTGNILNLFLLICFFSVNGHHRLIYMVSQTVQRIPIGQVGLNFEQLAACAVEIFTQTFMLGVMVALPMIAASLILEVILGVMIRTVPQMNMYVAGLPIKVMIGLFLLLVIFPVFYTMSDTIFDRMFEGVELMFEALVPIP